MTKYTDSGVELLSPEVRELPKYPYIDGAYVLERLVVVPDMNLKELAGTKKSYEPIWVFIGKNEQPVPPTILGCKMIIDSLYAALGKKSLANYKDDLAERSSMNAQEYYEHNKARLDTIQNELFGDESGLGGETITASGSSIIVPGNKHVH